MIDSVLYQRASDSPFAVQSISHYYDGSWTKLMNAQGQFTGLRYSVIAFGDGWILQDSLPEEPGYSFHKDGKTIYAARIVMETRNPNGVPALVKKGKELENEYLKGLSHEERTSAYRRVKGRLD